MSRLKQALNRARENRAVGSAGPQPEQGTGRHSEGTDGAAATAPEPLADAVAEPPAPEPRPARSAAVTTRLEETDPLTLRRNKILSFFHQGDMSDTVKMLRAQILSKLADIGGNTLLITSTNPREGKTFTAINLAVSLSHEIHRTTLLVDTDLRKPSVHEVIGIEGAAGLSDYLLGQTTLPEVLVNPGISNLTILPAGSVVANSTELLGSPRMLELVEEMKGRYADRLIIFDSSSVLTCADALAFSQHIDGVLLVVEAERTKRKDFQRAVELLAARPLLGVVYNKARE